MEDHTFRSWFIGFTAGAIIAFYFAVGYARKYKTMVAFVLPPFVCIAIAYDNIILAVYGLEDVNNTAVQVMLAFHACIVPLLLAISYEVAYLVHKQRSVNFCGIVFDSGHRAQRLHVCSILSRFAVWIVTLLLFTVNLVVNYEWDDEIDPSRRTSSYDLYSDASALMILSILPSLVLVIFTLYIGAQLWKYGTYYSFMIHATPFNPWIWMVVGSVAVAAGNIMPKEVYHVTSNAGEIVFLACLIRMFREVHHDIVQGRQMSDLIRSQSVSDVGLSAASNQQYQGIVTPVSHASNKSNSANSGSAPIPVDAIEIDATERTSRDNRIVDVA